MLTSVREREVRLHPLNRDFTWINTAPRSARRLSASEHDEFNAHGYVLLRDVFAADEIARVVETIDPLEAAGETWLRSKGGRVSISTADVITFTTHLVRKSPELRDFAAHRAVKDICHDLIGEDVR